MSVAGISSSALSQTLSAQQTTPASSSSTNSWKAYIKERHSDVVALDQALQSGNLSAAEQAYNNLVALGNTLPGDNPFVRSDRALDFNAIGGALANGNLAQAQQAFTTLRDSFREKLPPIQNPPNSSPDAVISLSGSATPVNAPNSPSAAVASAPEAITTGATGVNTLA